MIIDRLGKMFENRRKKDVPVEVERREDYKKRQTKKHLKKQQNKNKYKK